MSFNFRMLNCLSWYFWMASY